MKDFKTTESIVKAVLESNITARNNDDVLTLRVYGQIAPEVISMPFYVVMLNRKEYGLPSLKSIERARRKLQSKYPELSASEIVQAYRQQQEHDYIAYAKGENDAEW